MPRTYLEICSAYKVIQGIICEVRSKVDDLEADARALWEASTTPEEEAPASMLMDELQALSDVLSSWEGEDEEPIQR
jgi:hypothetical protein